MFLFFSKGPSEIRINKPASKESLIKLIGLVTSELPDTSAEHKLAAELFEFTNNTELKIVKTN